jgi:hypothetical protein
MGNCRRKHLSRGNGGFIERRALLVAAKELFVVFAGDGHFHDIHPDGKGGLGAGFLVAEGFAAVKANPDAAGN